MHSTSDSNGLREKLNDLHWNRKQSLRQMARDLGIDRRTLGRLMGKLGVPTRSYDDTAAVSLRINSEDEQILRQIAQRLKSMGYHSRFALAAKGGRNSRYRRNLWTLGLFRKREILDLIRRIPILHDEKVRTGKLVMKCGHQGWNEIRMELLELKSAIKNEVIHFTEEAESRYLKKHNGSLA